MNYSQELQDEIFSLEKDIYNSETIVAKCKNSYVYSQNLYAAICNNVFKKGTIPWSCSWRYAAGILTDVHGSGTYTDWYCSGIMNDIPGCVNEGETTDEIRLDLMKIGWRIVS